MTEKYLVDYPSGASYELIGEFKLAPVGDFLCPAILQDDDRAIFLDQRAIVTLNGKIVNSPLMARDGLEDGIRQWIKENPWWMDRIKKAT